MNFLTRFKIKWLVKRLKSMQQNRLHNQPNDEMLKKERDGYHKLANIYERLHGKKKHPFAKDMALECYRASAVIEDASAQYTLGKDLIEEAKFRQDIQQNSIFANSSNERQMKQLYEEGLAYLRAAQSLQHIEAKRLLGLCYINGWGVESDKKTGFDLIVDSIEQENSWEKVPQIFASIGLNKPEFFQALAQRRNVR